ncbi:MAG: hypothetical protein A3A96_03550 [Candidatus Zambryskibacteria bacterium RIFCSPLOWO2_01_FULL_39_39]|uniref:Uncharacterized protein n=1 Tax=Candidatus Zambryskibacteria bacterium RIFCSPLOWO2_01_FULL_39_39 TaxID=1802758 RepID=A0A1G2TXM5_9BACT|nr:MAG: hypothetical protein A2644_00810 [Candidatus Zambryskibacteria bacterium RIFCSPHIGHO2_01_FULL_39_63]OHA95147.1 MAG: hypothetical protein A3B88_02840 [Candidatus Zambryskibacteria bacterium RIFCSPHIGHO2_02_FULL_39_19]OHA98641.1 MAG: hypothetical protein A3F20_00090 [Candidatus Zambryskibacteria bacterium RIFCSPHIGHO2_12_FULL_39_21]OHB02055.1 MAG: hypothetical protein A3A96_03550 [Candidatus Zambryskibacteria bacterium RIFCSPLOWO2_01_FULL_39_39]
MKKITIIISIIVASYLVLTSILTATGVCPKYRNLMPRIVGTGIENIKGPNDAKPWHILFCPFAEKVY